MSINFFFVFLLGAMLSMFAYFKPSSAHNTMSGEIPKIELESFVIYEVEPQGVKRFFEGKEGKLFDERYEITSAKFSNNTKHLLESIQSDHALYQADFITLNGNVRYQREDGLQFRSEEGTYDQNRSIIRTEGDFVITRNRNRIEGTKLYYNIDDDTVSADAIRGSYHLDLGK
ncbi:MAG: LPS export ABC transporter periplasmic protein LptC [Sulfuricurvum sp.]|jgi:LPS export ABC transporter protein LptC|uniref:LPS export ABC transporter periplasmic protein LptC n=1 Tax=Sulfuricurvum sp. TaxID=2025608 RepID=UPI0025D51F32|nr:LPS export ABC transporter periplasmic protein LptC [Sulfuricurvum sp.]MCK9372893.1 LPS export ABC transporter periplasmic protein LptC [Sulfuricurvum sp.]